MSGLYVVVLENGDTHPWLVRSVTRAARDGHVYPRPLLTRDPHRAMVLKWYAARTLQCQLVARVDPHFRVWGPLP